MPRFMATAAAGAGVLVARPMSTMEREIMLFIGKPMGRSITMERLCWLAVMHACIACVHRNTTVVFLGRVVRASLSEGL